MRKKKNQAERLAALPNLMRFSTDCLRYDVIPGGESLDFGSVFGNRNPVWMEIGCGKGKFAVETAKRNPEVNIFAVEKTDKAVLSACESALRENAANLIFANINAEYLPRYIPAESVERLYLNFSCPYPKHGYENKRLTNPFFLKIYADFLKPGGRLCQKTDNMHFFEYSLEQLSACGWKIENVSLDLHNSGFEGNITTEYEEKFLAQGMPIYRLEAVRPG